MKSGIKGSFRCSQLSTGLVDWVVLTLGTRLIKTQPPTFLRHSLDLSQSSPALRFGVALRAGQQWRVNQCFTTAGRSARLHLMDELVGRSPLRKMGTEQWEHWGPLWASGRKKGVVVCVWGEFDREELAGKTLKGHSEGHSVIQLKKDSINNLIIQLKHNTCWWKEAGGNI